MSFLFCYLNLFFSVVLFKFLEKHKRRPNPELKAEDQKELDNLKVEVMEELKVDQEFLSDYFVRYVINGGFYLTVLIWY